MQKSKAIGIYLANFETLISPTMLLDVEAGFSNFNICEAHEENESLYDACDNDGVVACNIRCVAICIQLVLQKLIVVRVFSLASANRSFAM